MSTVRTVKTENYSIVANGFINDPSLSYQEIGLLTYLLSKPNDWKVNLKQLSSVHTNGKESVYGLMNSLAKKGYVVREQPREEGGRFEAVGYTVHEEPIGKTDCGNTASGFSGSGKHAYTNTELDKGLIEEKTENSRVREKEENPTRSPNKEGVGVSSSTNQPTSRQKEESAQQSADAASARSANADLARFFRAYPDHRRRADQHEIVRAWRRATEKPPIEAMLFKLKEQIASEQWTKEGGKYIPSIIKYLNESGWSAPIYPPPEPKYKTQADWNSAAPGKTVV